MNSKGLAQLAYDPLFATALPAFAMTGVTAVTLVAGDGYKSVFVRYFDTAGNASAVASDTVLLDRLIGFTSLMFLAVVVAIGLFAIGVIATLYMVMSNDMRVSYAATNPANIQVSVKATEPTCCSIPARYAVIFRI